ncbi:hypothetical protein [Candidatus Halobonum tyrrellensis]|nr:hypothetical protein [Candidatus Halobonum tyrrellensis]
MKPSETRSDDDADAQPVREKAHGLYETTKTHAPTIGFAAFVALTGMTAPVAAQAGSGICGTPLADTINQAAPLIVGLLMIGGAILSYILHNASAFPKNPQAVQEIKDWRNRAAFASITTPLFALVMQLFIGFTGTDLATCVDLVPFV